MPGADDYPDEAFSVDELLARLRVTQRRLSLMKTDAAQESPIFTNGALKIDYAAGCAYLDGAELHLTPIEYKLLCLLSKNVGKVLTHTYITQQIWGSSWENDIASLRVFMATLRKKVERGKDGQQYIQNAHRNRLSDAAGGVNSVQLFFSGRKGNVPNSFFSAGKTLRAASAVRFCPVMHGTWGCTSIC